MKIIFGHAIRQAQREAITHVHGEKWLIVGGGTGWVLEEVFGGYPEARITYLDASSKMIDKAKQRGVMGEVEYVVGTIDDLKKNTYDVIMTPFFWDMFTTDTAAAMKKNLDLFAKNDTQWLLVDFQNTDIWWQKLLMKVMYWFFRITCGIEARILPDFHEIYDSELYGQLFQKTFYHGMIESSIYRLKQ